MKESNEDLILICGSFFIMADVKLYFKAIDNQQVDLL